MEKKKKKIIDIQWCFLLFQSERFFYKKTKEFLIVCCFAFVFKVKQWNPTMVKRGEDNGLQGIMTVPLFFFLKQLWRSNKFPCQTGMGVENLHMVWKGVGIGEGRERCVTQKNKKQKQTKFLFLTSIYHITVTEVPFHIKKQFRMRKNHPKIEANANSLHFVNTMADQGLCPTMSINIQSGYFTFLTTVSWSYIVNLRNIKWCVQNWKFCKYFWMSVHILTITSIQFYNRMSFDRGGDTYIIMINNSKRKSEILDHSWILSAVS